MLTWSILGKDWMLVDQYDVLARGTRDILETKAWLAGLSIVNVDERCEVITVKREVSNA